MIVRFEISENPDFRDNFFNYVPRIFMSSFVMTIVSWSFEIAHVQHSVDRFTL